jgi:hypothetical protein
MPGKEKPMKFRIEIKSVLTIFILMILFFSLSLSAQENKGGAPIPVGVTNKPARSTKVIQVRYADVESLASILHPFQLDGGIVSFNRDIKVITISGDAETLNFMEETIKRFDVPPPSTKNVEITAYLLLGEETAAGAKIPGDLEGVIKQLKGVFPYSTFSLLDTLIIRCRDGKGGKANGIAPSKSPESYRTAINLQFDAVHLWSKGNQNLIRIDRLQLREDIPFKQTSSTHSDYQFHDAGISTDIDMLEGQKIVVGKSTVDGSNNAVFLVLSAKVME